MLNKPYTTKRQCTLILGNIHVLRKHKEGGGGGQPNAYFCLRGGGGGQGVCLRNHILEFFCTRNNEKSQKTVKNLKKISKITNVK